MFYSYEIYDILLFVGLFIWFIIVVIWVYRDSDGARNVAIRHSKNEFHKQILIQQREDEKINKKNDK